MASGRWSRGIESIRNQVTRSVLDSVKDRLTASSARSAHEFESGPEKDGLSDVSWQRISVLVSVCARSLTPCKTVGDLFVAERAEGSTITRMGTARIGACVPSEREDNSSHLKRA